MLVLVVSRMERTKNLSIEHIFGAMHSAKCIICIVSLNLGNNAMRNFSKIIKRIASYHVILNSHNHPVLSSHLITDETADKAGIIIYSQLIEEIGVKRREVKSVIPQSILWAVIDFWYHSFHL